MANQSTNQRITTDQQQLGEVYAKALLGVGEKAGTSETLIGELQQVNDAVGDLPTLGDALMSPQVSSDEKTALVEKAFEKMCSTTLMNFLRVVVQKGRFDCLPAVLVSAEKMHDQMLGKIQATLVTAEPVDDKTRDSIADKLSIKFGKQVELHPSVDPSIIGGVVVRVGDTVYDNSVSGQLEQVRAKALKRSADAIREKLNRFTNEN